MQCPPSFSAIQSPGHAITELSSRIDAVTYELLVLIREFDERGGWNNGFRKCGEISYSKARAITRVATSANEHTLLDVARCGTAAHVERIMRVWRQTDRGAEAADEKRRHRTRQLQTWIDDDGMVVIRGRLSPEVGAVLRRALEDGAGVSAETSRRLACDAATLTMRHGASGQILNIGRKTRTISPALRRALTTRDRHCRFPGCSAGHCDAHHVRHWANGGPTKLDNLVLLCRRHHRAVHEEGFTVRVGATGEAAFVRPDKQPLQNLPAPPRWLGGALAPTLDRLPGDEIAISPHTAMPHWHGERLDEGWAVSVLWRPRESVPTRRFTTARPASRRV